MPLIDALNNFRNSIAEAASFSAIAFQLDVNGGYLLAQSERDFITDSAFIKMFIAWETFLESSFIKYMLGEPSVAGNNLQRYVNPLDEKHAHKILIGTQKYVDWSNPEIVKKLCNIYFDPTTNPFNTFLSSIQLDLFDLKTIRNAAAHLSSTTSSQLVSLASRLLRRPFTTITVSQLIFSIDPTSTNNDTILTTYLSKIDVAAEGIARA